MSRRPGIEYRLEALGKSDDASLKGQFQDWYGQSAPIGISRSILQAAVGFKLQKVLISHLRHRMHQILIAGETIVSALAERHDHIVLIREWRGRCHAVVVTDDGVIYQGRRYLSLSAVARTITGTKISGEVFFRTPIHQKPNCVFQSIVAGRFRRS